jgi:predicted phosphate transport protein (TIGR00153 family)
MAMIFKKTRELEAQIDNYLDMVMHGALLFKQGLNYYLENLNNDFEERLKDLDKLESKGDGLRRDIESRIYKYTLIPEARGDVLGILESTDEVLNASSSTLIKFSIEKPEIPNDLRTLFLELTSNVENAVEAMISAIRAYFQDINAVRDHVSKVQFYEKESDKLAEKLKRKVFGRSDKLSKKIQIRYFVEHIDNIADLSEDVCDRLSIAAIKRFV